MHRAVSALWLRTLALTVAKGTGVPDGDLIGGVFIAKCLTSLSAASAAVQHSTVVIRHA